MAQFPGRLSDGRKLQRGSSAASLMPAVARMGRLAAVTASCRRGAIDLIVGGLRDLLQPLAMVGPVTTWATP